MIKKLTAFVLLLSLMVLTLAGTAFASSEEASFDYSETEALEAVEWYVPPIICGYPLSGVITSIAAPPYTTNIPISLNDGADLLSVAINNNYYGGYGRGGYLGSITWELTYGSSGQQINAY